jgi:D-alanine-D-alanine ligase
MNATERLRVAVVMGGVSTEHDVSMRSGAKIAEQLNPDAFDVESVTIDRDGVWHFPDRPPTPFHDAVPWLHQLGLDCVFLALHGPYGEDGRIQAVLDLLDLPYVGSSAAASALAMDKVRAKAVVREAGVPVAADAWVNRRDWEADEAEALRRLSGVGFPSVLKSPCQGSSLGMAMLREAAELSAAAGELFKIGDVVMTEQMLEGVEVTCGILDVEPGQRPRALPVTEIAPLGGGFFDYKAKYTPGACEEITPARISPEQTAEVQRLAVLAHEAVGCADFSRSDMILVNGNPVWLEVNTIPGMTDQSLLPQAAAAEGISYSELVGMLVHAAVYRHRRARKPREADPEAAEESPRPS